MSDKRKSQSPVSFATDARVASDTRVFDRSSTQRFVSFANADTSDTRVLDRPSHVRFARFDNGDTSDTRVSDRSRPPSLGSFASADTSDTRVFDRYRYSRFVSFATDARVASDTCVPDRSSASRVGSFASADTSDTRVFDRYSQPRFGSFATDARVASDTCVPNRSRSWSFVSFANADTSDTLVFDRSRDQRFVNTCKPWILDTEESLKSRSGVLSTSLDVSTSPVLPASPFNCWAMPCASALSGKHWAMVDLPGTHCDVPPGALPTPSAAEAKPPPRKQHARGSQHGHQFRHAPHDQNPSFFPRGHPTSPTHTTLPKAPNQNTANVQQTPNAGRKPMHKQLPHIRAEILNRLCTKTAGPDRTDSPKPMHGRPTPHPRIGFGPFDALHRPAKHRATVANACASSPTHTHA